MVFNKRRIVSLTLLLTLVAMPISAVVAHAMHGVQSSHHTWLHIHVVCGVTFVVAGIFHIIYNWRVLRQHLMGRGK